MYTWNLRTGVLDSFVANTGLEFVGWTLVPGKWAHAEARNFLSRYVYLVGVRRENEELSRRLSVMALDLSRYREQAREVERLRKLLRFVPPPHWEVSGARIITHRLGPNAALETIIVDKGAMQNVGRNTPLVTSRGVVGRILRAGANFSTVLLITDPNSSVAVVGQKYRSSAILAGRGPGNELEARYVDRNAALEEGELLVTSGLAGIFPKGLPVARVVRAERSDISLFQRVWAAPLVELRHIEEALLLTREPEPEQQHEAAPAALPEAASGS